MTSNANLDKIESAVSFAGAVKEDRIAVTDGVGLVEDAPTNTEPSKPSAGGVKEDETKFNLWANVQKRGLLPEGTVIPMELFKWYAVNRGICAPDDIIDGKNLSPTAHNRTISQLNKEGIDSGMSEIVERKEGDLVIIKSVEELKEYITHIKRTKRKKNGRFDFLCNGHKVFIRTADIMKYNVWSDTLIEEEVMITFSIKKDKRPEWIAFIEWFYNGAEETDVVEISDDDMARDLILNDLANLIVTDDDERFRKNDSTCKIVDGVRIVKWKSLLSITHGLYTPGTLHYILKPSLAKNSDQQRVAGIRMSLWYFKDSDILVRGDTE